MSHNKISTEAMERLRAMLHAMGLRPPEERAMEMVMPEFKDELRELEFIQAATAEDLL